MTFYYYGIGNLLVLSSNVTKTYNNVLNFTVYIFVAPIHHLSLGPDKLSKIVDK